MTAASARFSHILLPVMDSAYKEKGFVVPSYWTGRDGRLSPEGYLLLFQELAYRGAEPLGFGFRDMTDRGLAWVLVRSHFRVLRGPSLGERVTLETWHRGLQGALFVRDYRVLDSLERPIVLGTSSWAVIDTAARRMVRISHLSDLISMEPQSDECALPEFAGKVVPAGEEDAGHTLQRRVFYTDTDVVGHLNNAMYLKWAMDLEHVADESRNPVEVTTNFLHETREGEELSFTRRTEADVSFITASSGGVVRMLTRVGYGSL